MICLDTTFLIDLWRSRGKPDQPARRILARYPEELLVVCIPIAGEFLEGAVYVSEQRYREALQFLHLYALRPLDIETAGRYARLVADLRRSNRLHGASKADLWLAAFALQHQARVASQNVKHFQAVETLQILSY